VSLVGTSDAPACLVVSIPEATSAVAPDWKIYRLRRVVFFLAVVFFVDRLAVFFLATLLFVAFFLVDGLAFLAGFFLVAVFFFVDRLAVFLLAVFFFVAVFFLVDRLAFVAGRFVAVFFFVAIYEAPEGSGPIAKNTVASSGAPIQRKLGDINARSLIDAGQMHSAELNYLHDPTSLAYWNIFANFWSIDFSK